MPQVAPSEGAHDRPFRSGPAAFRREVARQRPSPPPAVRDPRGSRPLRCRNQGREASDPATPAAGDLVARPEQLETQLAAGAGHEGVYAYETRHGTRWRYVFRDADRRLSSRRGFTSADEAGAACRERIAASRAGERLASGLTFGEFWTRLLENKRPYLTPGTLEDLATHGRKRLLPASEMTGSPTSTRTGCAPGSATWSNGSTPASSRPRRSTMRARACPWRSAKPYDGLMPSNPCAHVRQLPVERQELDFLRLPEIEISELST